MNVNVQISLSPNEYASDLPWNATECANRVLEAIGGDPTKDSVSVFINDSGAAGMSMMPPPISEPVPIPESPPEQKK